MRICKFWIGGDPYQWQDGRWDGHHRKRAAVYIKDKFGILIDVPPILKEQKQT